MLAPPQQRGAPLIRCQLRGGPQARYGSRLLVVAGARPHYLGEPDQVVSGPPACERGVEDRPCLAGPAVPGQQVGKQRQPVRHPCERAMGLQVVDPLPGEADARLVGAGPAVQNQRPLAVVGEVIPITQSAQLVDGIPERGQILAHLVGDTAVGQGHGQAVRVVDRAGQLDGVLTARPGLKVVTQQPVGVRGPRHGVHVGAGADAQRGGTAGQLRGELEVTQPVRGHPEADG